MGTIEDLTPWIGASIVVAVAISHFNAPPPPRPHLPKGVPRLVGTMVKWFKAGDERAGSLLAYYPPPRANTTLLKFELCRAAYVVLGLVIYLTLNAAPIVRGQFEQIMVIASGVIPGAEAISLAQAGPLVLGFIVAVILPAMPPFKGADESIRRALYEGASIPARQLRESSRLKEAEYEPDQQLLERVRHKLAPEGFDPSDIVYKPGKPTTRSLWTKCCLLIQHMRDWQVDNRYSTAFAVLAEPDGGTRSIERIEQAHAALMGDAKACLKALREQRHAPETAEREEKFRRNCKDLLLMVYHLLSRVSLHSHYSDRERVRCMGEIGFRLQPDRGGPVPDGHDLAYLGILLGAVLMLPLSFVLGFTKALIIAAIMYSVVLMPVMLAHWFHGFTGGAQRLAFPIVSGLAAASVGAAIGIVCFESGDLMAGWERYAARSYPWSALHALLSALIAWRMGAGSYPDSRRLTGLARYREWGSLRDAAIFAVAVAVLMTQYVLPRFATLIDKPDIATDPVRVAIGTLAAAVIGFLVPTWYRANLRRMATHADTAPPAPDRVDPAPPHASPERLRPAA
ncbi:MAG: hypothetical protein ACE5GS_01480 [Kiloniellaceae bacterium]